LEYSLQVRLFLMPAAAERQVVIFREKGLRTHKNITYEDSGSHIKGSVNIPLAKLPFELAKFKNKKTIVVCCQSGGRSEQAKAILEQNGFTNVVNGGT
jgi:rhodanese-related sulfurtransferase